MAAPLGTVVFKVPELGKVGYDIEQREEAKQLREESKRESKLYRTGGDSTYNQNAYKLQGKYKTGVTMLYNEFQKLGEEFEETGDESKLRQAQAISSQMQSLIQDYHTQVGIPLKKAGMADQVGWEGYVGSREDFDTSMSSMMQEVPQKFENGIHKVLENGEYIPWAESTHASQTPNPNNSVIVQKATTLGTYVIPSAYEVQNRYIGLNATNLREALQNAKSQFEYDYQNNPEFVNDMAVAWEISNGKLGDVNKIPASAVSEVEGKIASDSAYKDKVVKWYQDKLFELTELRFNQRRTSNNYGMSQVFAEDSVPQTAEVDTQELPAMDFSEIELDLEPKKKSNEVTDVPVLRENFNYEKVQNFIDEKSKGQSPLDAEDFFSVAKKYDVPVDFLLAQAALESNFGTKGMGKRTKNMGNVGNNGNTGKETYMDSYLDGLEKMASLLSRRYRPKGNNWESLLDDFVNDKGYRYAEEAGYEDAVSGLITELYA